ncbi:MAG: GTP 3',8-cyclase MoaA [Akkermansiaceae bacterium]|jgi:cyclic pyranopterin phosphate synthase|nr:GTP 3',8-cyclase MoaA [Akkermansiaceae bacterium]
MDPFGRHIDYLRVSVTDRCNERCLYCMPKGYKGWAGHSDHLTADEIVRIIDQSTTLGFRKFRLTGGEPLVRKDIVEIARRVWELPGVQTLGISTNGVLLKDLAVPLKQAGVRSVNISLDALDADIYRKLTGGRLDAALDGIGAAKAAGFEVVKLNCVLLRGVNDDQIPALVKFGAALGMPVRFIELMPLAPGGPVDERHFMSITEAMARLAEHGPLEPAHDKPHGHGPARYYKFRGAHVGFIGSITCADFCKDCNKLRLTADGKLRPCLGRHGEIDLMPALRGEGASVTDALHEAIANKPENHAFADDFQVNRPMTAIGG